MYFAYLFRRMARQYRDRPALIDDQGVWTYGTEMERIQRLANALLGLGLAGGDRVAILQGDTREYLESEYAVMAAGLVRVPLDLRLTVPELQAILRDADPRAIIYQADLAERAHAACADLPALAHYIQVGGERSDALAFEELIQVGAPWLTIEVDSDAPASLNYSGGTTGQPKAILLSQRNIIAAVQTCLVSRWAHHANVFLNVRPIWPIAGIHVLIQLAGGATVVLGGRFNPERFWHLVVQHRATHTSLVPTQIVRLLAHGAPPPDALASVREILSGGSALTPDTFREAVDMLGPRVGVLYGLAEAPTTCYLPAAELKTPGPRRDYLMSTVGREGFVNELQIVDEGDQPLDIGQAGEVVIRGPNVMRGYWNQPELTAQTMRGGWLHTGDLGQLDDDGYLRIVGRLKEVIKSGALSIYPAEVEAVLLAHPAVAEAAVLGVPDPEWGEAVKAVVVLQPGASITADALVEHCRQRLASYKKPRLVEFADALPRSHYGKVLKTELR